MATIDGGTHETGFKNALTKVMNAYAKKIGVKPEDMYVVSIMPCTAKKYEKTREQLVTEGLADVDAVLTTRELARMIKRSGINFNKLADEEFDNDIVGEYTGAGVIFGVTGGVMEAALRSAGYIITGKEFETIEYTAVRGFEGIKEASVERYDDGKVVLYNKAFAYDEV